MKKTEFLDPRNLGKVWTIKQYECGHYYASFQVNGVVSKFKRCKLSSITKVVGLKANLLKAFF